MAQSSKGPGPGMPFDLSQFGGMGTGTLESMTEAGRKLMEATASANKEIFDFVNRRLNEDIATQQKLLQSRTFDEIQKVYSDYFQTASAQYMSEFQKLMTMASNSAKDATETVTKPGK